MAAGGEDMGRCERGSREEAVRGGGTKKPLMINHLAGGCNCAARRCTAQLFPNLLLHAGRSQQHSALSASFCAGPSSAAAMDSDDETREEMREEHIEVVRPKPHRCEMPTRSDDEDGPPEAKKREVGVERKLLKNGGVTKMVVKHGSCTSPKTPLYGDVVTGPQFATNFSLGFLGFHGLCRIFVLALCLKLALGRLSGVNCSVKLHVH